MIHRIWKFVGILHCPDGMIAVQYAICDMRYDASDEREGKLMMATVEAVREAGCGTHRLRVMGERFIVQAHMVREHPMQARQWMGMH